jgi:hypothetical protein
VASSGHELQVELTHPSCVDSFEDGGDLGAGEGAWLAFVEWDGADEGAFSDDWAAVVEVYEVDVGVGEVHEVGDEGEIVGVGVWFEHDADVEVAGVRFASGGAAEDGEDAYSVTGAQLVELAGLGGSLERGEAIPW